MTRFLLDTSIVSEATRPRPLASVTKWLGRQLDSQLFIATLTLAEIKRGILEKPPGRKRRELEKWFDGPEGPQALFRGRILPFDERAAVEWARLMASGTTAGRPRSSLDMVIAATAAANQCAVVSGDERHFKGTVALINPLSAR
ncbi:MAG: PIN domain-containing protein [Myxococcales bacterium]|nr:PIN domain-containing protein [Myxococcales bacterium]